MYIYIFPLANGFGGCVELWLSYVICIKFVLCEVFICGPKVMRINVYNAFMGDIMKKIFQILLRQ